MGSVLTVAVVLTVIAAAWLGHSALFPWVKCGWCGGSGISKGSKRTYRPCPACKGQRQLRRGARWVRPDLRRK